MWWSKYPKRERKKYWPAMTAIRPAATSPPFQSESRRPSRNITGTIAAAISGGTVRDVKMISDCVAAPVMRQRVAAM